MAQLVKYTYPYCKDFNWFMLNSQYTSVRQKILKSSPWETLFFKKKINRFLTLHDSMPY